MIFRETLIHIQLFQKNSVKLKQDFNNSYGKFFAAFFFIFILMCWDFSTPCEILDFVEGVD